MEMDKQSTPINQLPTHSDSANNTNGQDEELVQNILKEINNPNVMSNDKIAARQMDPQSQNEGPPPDPVVNEQPTPTPAQIFQQYPTQTLQPDNTKTLSSNYMLKLFKEPIIVSAIVMALSLPLFNKILKNIPKALSETGNITFIGYGFRSILAGLIFFAITKLV